MRRLYLQIYLAFVGIVLLFVVLVAAVWHLSGLGRSESGALEGIAGILAGTLPGADQPAEAQRQALERLRSHVPGDFALRSADGTLVASVGDPLPMVRPDRRASGWIHSFGTAPAFAFHLPDGRWLLARHGEAGHGRWALTAVGLLAVAIAVGAYPVARRITRRVETLQARVEALGAGDLAVRVEAEGCDEVAALARSFNRAAERIERLVKAQRSVLVSASHELRSPLARIRMALELLPAGDRPDLRKAMEREIALLDDLIGELLLASRLETHDRPEQVEEVDLLGLVAEEAARTGAEATGEPVRIKGDPRLLRRLVRNLLENAERHAPGSAAEASVAALPSGGARLRVLDRGPGVPEAERERIFEPFYRLSPGGPGAGAAPAANGAPATEAAPGVGLGLALVRQIARHHGGDARCLPREGGGSCFEVDLPGF